MVHIWTPVQAPPNPLSISGLSPMGEQVLQIIRNKYLNHFNIFNNMTSTPSYCLQDKYESALLSTFEKSSTTCNISLLSQPSHKLRSIDTTSAKWQSNTISHVPQVNGETSSGTNMNITLASNAENHSFQFKPNQEQNRLNKALAVPMFSVFNPRNEIVCTAYREEQRKMTYLEVDKHCKENMSKEFNSYFKPVYSSSSCHKHCENQSELLCEEQLNKDETVIKLGANKTDSLSSKSVINVSQTEGSELDIFDGMLEAENLFYKSLCGTTTNVSLQHNVQESEQSDRNINVDNKMGTHEVFSCDKTKPNAAVALNGVKYDKQQRNWYEANSTAVTNKKVVTQSANASIECRNGKKNLKDYFQKVEKELQVKHQILNNSEDIQQESLTPMDNHQKEYIFPQDQNNNNNKGSEVKNVGNSDVTVTENLLSEKLGKRSSKISNCKEKTSSNLTKRTGISSYMKKKRDNRFLKGKINTHVNKKLKIPEMFEKSDKKKDATEHNHERCEISTKDNSNMTNDEHISTNKSNRKRKFQAPFKNKSFKEKQDQEKNTVQIYNCEDFNFISLNDKSVHDISTKVLEDGLLEVGITILYREGFSQLNKPTEISKWAHCTPAGLMLAITLQTGLTDFYYLSTSDDHWKDKNTSRTFLSLLLNDRCRKLCYGAQELIIFLMDKYDFDSTQVCFKWILLDPKVGCWLLDPDHPPCHFADTVTSLGLKKQLYSISWNVKTIACCQLKLLSSLAEKLYHKLQEHELWKLFLNIEMKLVPILAVMELRGIFVDVKKLSDMEIVLEEQMDKLQNSAYKAAGKNFQLNSVQQLCQILYDDLKLDQKANIKVKATESRGAKSTSTSMLKLLQPFHPLPGIVLEYRHLQKLKSTYVTGMLQHIKGSNIFTSWQQTAAATGRLISSNPNLQSVPKQPIILVSETSEKRSLFLRSPFIPHSENSFLAADFQHIEFRIFAHLAEDRALMQMFHEPGDIFMNLAQMWLGKEGEILTSVDREKTKRIVYAIMYGAGPQKLAETLQVKGEEADSIIRSFNAICPVLQTFRQQMINQCQKKGYLSTIGGRRRLFPNISNSNLLIQAHAERQAINFVIQGSAADLCKLAMLHTQRMLQEKQQDHDAHLLLQIHDELVWEVNSGQLANIKETVQKAMEDSKTFFGLLESLSIPLPVVISTGKTWAEMTP